MDLNYCEPIYPKWTNTILNTHLYFSRAKWSKQTIRTYAVHQHNHHHHPPATTTIQPSWPFGLPSDLFVITSTVFFFFISIPITKSERGNLRVQKWKCPTSPPINYINIWNGDAIHFFFFFIIFRFVQKRVRASYSISSYSHRSACCMPNVRDEKKKTHSHPIRIRQLRCYRWVETSISFFFHYKLPVIMSLDDEPKRRLVVVWKLCSDDGHVTSKGY